MEIDKEKDIIGPTDFQEINAEAILNQKLKGNPFPRGMKNTDYRKMIL